MFHGFSCSKIYKNRPMDPDPWVFGNPMGSNQICTKPGSWISTSFVVSIMSLEVGGKPLFDMDGFLCQKYHVTLEHMYIYLDFVVDFLW